MLPQQVVGLHLSQLLVSPRLQSWMDWDSKDFKYVDLNILGWGLNGATIGGWLQSADTLVLHVLD